MVWDVLYPKYYINDADSDSDKNPIASGLQHGIKPAHVRARSHARSRTRTHARARILTFAHTHAHARTHTHRIHTPHTHIPHTHTTNNDKNTKTVAWPPRLHLWLSFYKWPRKPQPVTTDSYFDYLSRSSECFFHCIAIPSWQLNST